jgi:hypothetical protein
MIPCRKEDASSALTTTAERSQKSLPLNLITATYMPNPKKKKTKAMFEWSSSVNSGGIVSEHNY